MSETERTTVSSQQYQHGQISDELDQLNRKLEEMKETILNTSVRAHLLEADIATLYDPSVAESLREAKLDCERCKQSLFGVQ